MSKKITRAQSLKNYEWISSLHKKANEKKAERAKHSTLTKDEVIEGFAQEGIDVLEITEGETDYTVVIQTSHERNAMLGEWKPDKFRIEDYRNGGTKTCSNLGFNVCSIWIPKE